MHRKHSIINALLWASAILASAILGAPKGLTVVLLPALAYCALMQARPKSRSTDGSLCA